MLVQLKPIVEKIAWGVSTISYIPHAHLRERIHLRILQRFVAKNV
jgi:hypothetical protein